MIDENMIRDIEMAYGSIIHPNWSFVEKSIKSGRYHDLLKELSELGLIEETTDANDDCSRSFFWT